MDLTYFSVMMAIVWFSAFVYFGDYLRKKNGFLLYYTASSILALFIFSSLRLFLPIELPFTITVEEEVLFPQVQAFLKYKLFALGNCQVTVIFALTAAYCAKVASLISRLVLDIRDGLASADLIAPMADDRPMAIMEHIVSSTGSRSRYRLIVSEEIKTPKINGFFAPVILLPHTINDLPDDDLQYILLHEWYHFLNKDHWIKLLERIFHCVMWWNPAIKRLQEYLTHVLELRCDLSVAKYIGETKTPGYMETILWAISEKSGETRRYLEHYFVPPKAPKSGNRDVLQRIELLSYYKDGQHRATTRRFWLFASLLFLSSYLFVIQPHTKPPIDEITTEESVYIAQESSFVVAHEDGTYSLFWDSEELVPVPESSLNDPPLNTLPIIKENKLQEEKK